MKKILLLLLLLSLTILTSCRGKEQGKETQNSAEIDTAEISAMDFSFSDGDQNSDFDDDDIRTGTLSDSVLKISAAGSYILRGNDITQILVEAGDSDKVQIVLDGATIANKNGPAIYIRSADKVFITAKEGTENIISDGEEYSFTDGESSVDAAIFSRADLTVNGKGALDVSGNAKHAVVSKDDLVVYSLKLSVKAKNAGLSGKDCVKIGKASVTVTAGSDAIRSDNTESEDHGYVFLSDSDLALHAGNDGIQAETVIKSENAALTIESGGGSADKLSSSTESYKGLKAGSDIVIESGSYAVNSKDDCIHSNHTISIKNGTFELSSGDDGIHADSDLSVSGGNIKITKSYEALEATRIVISGGEFDLVSSDDGLNAAGGNDSSAMGGRPGMGGFSSSKGEVHIQGGYLLIDASGDGIDANGSILVSGGVTLLSGPTNSGNGSFDYDTTATVTGGSVIALGSSGMAQGFSSAEGQGAAFFSFSSQKGETPFAVVDGDNNVVASFTPKKAYQCAVVTCKGLEKGESYRVVVGGKVAAADSNGYAESGTSEGGEEIFEFTMSSELYSAGGSGFGGMGGPGGMDRPMDRPNKNHRW